MAEQRYIPGPNETIVLKKSKVKHGSWDGYLNELILTTDKVICVELNLFGDHLANFTYPLNRISQVVVGETSNGEKRLELHMDNGSVEEFSFRSDNSLQVRLWATAIEDRFEDNNEIYDSEYYQALFDSCKDEKYENPKYFDASDVNSASGFSGKDFLEDVTANVIKSGNYTTRGVIKGVKKAAKQQTRKKKNSIIENLKEDLGYYDLVDEFTEIGNDFREELGIDPKVTHAQEKAAQEAEAFSRRVEAFKRTAAERTDKSFSAADDEGAYEIGVVTTVELESPKGGVQQLSIAEQIDAVKKLKELVDTGILTEEEFSIKKKEIMGL